MVCGQGVKDDQYRDATAMGHIHVCSAGISPCDDPEDHLESFQSIWVNVSGNNMMDVVDRVCYNIGVTKPFKYTKNSHTRGPFRNWFPMRNSEETTRPTRPHSNLC